MSLTYLNTDAFVTDGFIVRDSSKKALRICFYVQGPPVSNDDFVVDL